MTTYPHLYIHNAVRQKGKKYHCEKKKFPHTKQQAHKWHNSRPAKYTQHIRCSHRLDATYCLGLGAWFHGRCSSCVSYSHLFRSWTLPGTTQKIHSFFSFCVWHFWKEQGVTKCIWETDSYAFLFMQGAPGFMCFVCSCVKRKYSFGAGVIRGPVLSYSFITWWYGFHEPLCGFVAREDPVQSLLNFYFHFWFFLTNLWVWCWLAYGKVNSQALREQIKS